MKDKEGTQYCLKLDIEKYYPSINRQLLKNMYKTMFKDDDLLWLLEEIIDSPGGECGVPIGNYLSQYSGNLFLSRFDRWLKEEKKIKYYIRYMDDIVILHENKEYLHALLKSIKNFLYVELKLSVKSNWQIFPSRVRGIDFVGYRHFGRYILLRKSISKNLTKAMKKTIYKVNVGEDLSYSDYCSIESYKGWIKFCNGFNLYLKWIAPLEIHRIEFYKKNLKVKQEVGAIKRFSDFAKLDNSTHYGKNKKIQDVLNTEIEISGYRVRVSKFVEGESFLTLFFTQDEQKFFLFTGSKVLMSQIKTYESELPFYTTIIKKEKYYSFS